MLRFALSMGILAAFSSGQAWALPQSSACRASGRSRAYVPSAPLCVVLQDPWQDCDEDPWQLSSPTQASDDVFDDPWQDEVDPWQSLLASSPVATDLKVDPRQRVVPQLASAPVAAEASDTAEDPWQPGFQDPWQDGADDPWQLP